MIKSKIKKAKTIILPITGGIGRNIFATAVIKNLKLVYPDKNVFVIAGYPDIFLNNPNIKRVYGFNTVHHLYEDYIDKKPDTLLLEVEPYRHPQYLSGDMHIVKAWCDLLEIPCEDIYPDLHFVQSELEMGRLFVENLEQKFNKPLILFQNSGGKIPDNNQKEQEIINRAEMHRRSLPNEVAQEISDQLSKDGYLVGCVQTPNQFCPNGAERIFIPLRAIMTLIPHVSGIIGIDSFLQHASASFKKQALVAWAGTSPDRLGYDLHKNLRRNVCPTPECHRPNSYAFDIQANGMIWSCPYSDRCTNYDAKQILNAYKEMKGESYLELPKKFKKDRKPEVVNKEKHVHKPGQTCPVHGG